jgi:hypothetical protein
MFNLRNPPFLKAADLEMNLGSKEVRRAGRLINLTAKRIPIIGIPAAQ